MERGQKAVFFILSLSEYLKNKLKIFFVFIRWLKIQETILEQNYIVQAFKVDTCLKISVTWIRMHLLHQFLQPHAHTALYIDVTP